MVLFNGLAIICLKSCIVSRIIIYTFRFEFCEMAWHFLFELWQVSKVYIPYLSSIPTKAIKVLIMTHNDLIIFCYSDIHFEHRAELVLKCTFECLEGIFWGFQGASSVGNEISTIAWTELWKLYLLALCMNKSWILE